MWPCPAGTVSNVRVDTVAVGNDASADTTLLQNIVDRFGSTARLYNIAAIGQTETLKEVFIMSLEDLYQLNLVARSVSGVAVPPGIDITGGGVNIGVDNRKLVFILSWQTATDAAVFTVQRRNTAADPWANVPCDQSGSSTDVGFAMCLINNPQPGLWRAVNPATPSTSQFVLVDLSLRARFAINDRVHGTGQPLLLTANLNDHGLPMSADRGYTVTARVSRERPQESLGEFLTTHLPDNCRVVREPTLPDIPVDFLKDLVSRDEPYLGGVLVFPPFPPPVPTGTARSQQDVPKPAFLLTQALFNACDKEGLQRGSEELQLVDDGSQGDATANDGIYSLAIVPEFEGSEDFRFTAVGKTPKGEDFSRIRLLSRYIRTEVSLPHSPTRSVDFGNVISDMLTLHYVIPRDTFGRHLGPGHGDQVTFMANGGNWVSPTIDFNNGIYGRVLRYPRDQAPPKIDLVVQDESTNPDYGDPYEPDPPSPCPEPSPGPFGLAWKVIVVILVLIVGLLLLIIVFRRRH
jgi:hypothetical protein